MSKYDFKIDLSDKSSTGLILDKIAAGSVVLEFGCANGRMTRYMKEELSCSVYIVEYDEPAYNDALQYAQDGLCDDIENLRWLDRFSGTAFDAIIFADVLEHLHDPGKILMHAAQLLKDSGSILISAPNITHNDVLLKAYDERFDYTDTGLLDNTHIHFWGMRNIAQMAEKCGLALRSLTGTYCETGSTEQMAASPEIGSILLKNVLRERECGEVYQFIAVMDKTPHSEAVTQFRKPTITSHIYVDTGSDFDAGECIAVDSVLSNEGSYHMHFELKNVSGVKRVRFDPVEGQNCILQNVSFQQGDDLLTLISTSDAALGQGYIFLGDDPMVYAELTDNETPVVIEADICIWGETYLKLLTDEYMGRVTDIGRLHDEKEAARAEALEEIFSRDRSIRELLDKVDALNAELEQCRSELGAFLFLANQKDVRSIEIERELSKLRCDVNFYENLDVVRMRRFAARVVKGIWRRVKRIFGKGEQ